jgi:hypothetical protein
VPVINAAAAQRIPGMQQYLRPLELLVSSRKYPEMTSSSRSLPPAYYVGNDEGNVTELSQNVQNVQSMWKQTSELAHHAELRNYSC